MRIRIWRRRRRDAPVRTEARAALKRAEVDRQQIQDRGPEVDRAVALLREIRERNHFAEMISRALQGGGG
jgi:hypothetical protein